MGEIQGYNISRNDISDRVCVGNVEHLGTGSWTLKADYSSGLDNTIAVVGQGTSAAPYHHSNLNYGGICLDEDWMDKLCKEIKGGFKTIGESKDYDEITVPPMRGFIEI